MLRRLLILVLVVGFAGAASALARNVDLSTVPKRNTVQLTIYNSEDLTLVRETRAVTFKKGNNPLQFSWANTLIDSSSVELKFLSNGEKLNVTDTTFPHDKPQMLYWNVKSEFDGEATIQISYFTSGITWSADYTLIAGADEKTVAMEGFVRVYNNSGEAYEDAQVRLVVGKINLVEKIAQLARVATSEVLRWDQEKSRDFKRDAMKDSIVRGEVGNEGWGNMPSTSAAKPKQVVKEGLSEYFIFSIEGTETIPNGWSKRMRSAEAGEVPVKIQYRYRPNEYGEQLVRMYLLTNDVASKLGTSPLPDGVYRVFRENGRGGLSYLTQQTLKYIPVGDKVELKLGVDPEVLFELVKKRSYRDGIWMQRNGTDVLRRVEDGAFRVEVDWRVSGWLQHTEFVQRIRNYTTKPVEVEVRRSYSGDVEFCADLPGLKSYDYLTPEFTVGVEAGKKVDFPFEVVVKHGHLVKQNRVEIKKPAATMPGK